MGAFYQTPRRKYYILSSFWCWRAFQWRYRNRPYRRNTRLRLTLWRLPLPRLFCCYNIATLWWNRRKERCALVANLSHTERERRQTSKLSDVGKCGPPSQLSRQTKRTWLCYHSFFSFKSWLHSRMAHYKCSRLWYAATSPPYLHCSISSKNKTCKTVCVKRKQVWVDSWGRHSATGILLYWKRQQDSFIWNKQRHSRCFRQFQQRQKGKSIQKLWRYVRWNSVHTWHYPWIWWPIYHFRRYSCGWNHCA